MKVQLGPTTNLFPMPALLVAVRTGKGTANVLAIAWSGILGGSPPMISIHLGRNHFSTAHIRREQCFSVNVPSCRLHVAVDYCGMVSGRKDPDKAATCGLTLIPSSKIGAPIVQECPINLECELEREMDMGGGVLFVGRIVETHVDEEALDDKRRVITDRVDPLVFLPNAEYRRLGEYLSPAFKVGKQLVRRSQD